MDKYERRRQRLIELLNTRCDGVAANMARKIGRSPSYVIRMLYPEGKPGKKRIAEDMKDVIETAFGIPGWLDAQEVTNDNNITLDGTRYKSDISPTPPDLDLNDYDDVMLVVITAAVMSDLKEAGENWPMDEVVSFIMELCHDAKKAGVSSTREAETMAHLAVMWHLKHA